MSQKTFRLTYEDHNRDQLGKTYVYEVLSRRAGGVSVGINLNTNNACNWHCVYCQVPGLVRGKAPIIDVDMLERELDEVLALHEQDGVVVRDIAFSGNGEPTSSAQFGAALERVRCVRARYPAVKARPLRLITNGSQLDRDEVVDALAAIADEGGEVWFKLDAGTEADWVRINGIHQHPEQVLRRLARCASICPTWIQTCLFAWQGKPPTEAAIQAYLEMLRSASAADVRGVLLYGVIRPSMQPEAGDVTQLSVTLLEEVAEQIRALGFEVRVSP